MVLERGASLLVCSLEDLVHGLDCVVAELWVLGLVSLVCGLSRVVVAPCASVVLSLLSAASGVVAYWGSWTTYWWTSCGKGKGKT